MKILIFVLAAALAGAAYAQGEAKPHKGVGVVKSLDAEKGTVMLAHEPIPSLRWPAMTMKFAAKERKLLEKLAPGQKVEFEFLVQGKDYVLTSLKPR